MKIWPQNSLSVHLSARKKWKSKHVPKKKTKKKKKTHTHPDIHVKWLKQPVQFTVRMQYSGHSLNGLW